MAAYRLVYDSRHLQAGCQESGSAPEPYARQSSMGYLYLLVKKLHNSVNMSHKSAVSKKLRSDQLNSGKQLIYAADE